jgi:hypothetical protein
MCILKRVVLSRKEKSLSSIHSGRAATVDGINFERKYLKEERIV